MFGRPFGTAEIAAQDSVYAINAIYEFNEINAFYAINAINALYEINAFNAFNAIYEFCAINASARELKVKS